MKKAQFSTIRPDPKNPRKASDKKILMLQNSIRKLGSIDGVVYNCQLDKLVGGHQRQKAFPESDITIEREYDPPTPAGTVAEGFVLIEGERFPYRVVDWDDATHKIANAAANKGAGEWDWKALSELILELDHLNQDLDFTMFDKDEIERFFGGWDDGAKKTEKDEENLDGIKATIKVTCPQEIKDEVLVILKRAFLETSLEGVEVV